MKVKANNADKSNTKMHFRISRKSNLERIRKCISMLTCNSEKTKYARKIWKFNFLKTHCSSKLPIKHVAQLNNLSKLLITQTNAQFYKYINK